MDYNDNVIVIIVLVLRQVRWTASSDRYRALFNSTTTRYVARARAYRDDHNVDNNIAAGRGLGSPPCDSTVPRVQS